MTRQSLVNSAPAASGGEAATLLQRENLGGHAIRGPADEFGDGLHDRTTGSPTRLTISAADDPYEQEADRAAAVALQAPVPSSIFVRPIARPIIARRASPSGIAGRQAPASLANSAEGK